MPFCGLHAPFYCGWDVFGADSLVCEVVLQCGCLRGLAMTTVGTLINGARLWPVWLRGLTMNAVGMLVFRVAQSVAGCEAWL